MSDRDDLVYLYAKNFMMEIMAVLWMHGQRELHVGAMMRLMGIDDETAQQHDNERVTIDEEFGLLLQNHATADTESFKMPKNTTLH